MNTVMKSENAALKAAINQTGLSWEDFSRQSRIAVTVMDNIMRGRIPATVLQARKIVKALGLRHVIVDASMLIVDLSCDEAQQVAEERHHWGASVSEIDTRFIWDQMSVLLPREREVLVLRFGLSDGYSRTLEEVGRQLRVTRERIRQVEARALRKLRHPARRLRQCCPWVHSDE